MEGPLSARLIRSEMKTGLFFIAILPALFLCPYSYGQNTYLYSPPEKLEDGWETGNLRTLDVDTSRIYQLFNQLQGGRHKIHSILLVRDGRIVIEKYFGEYVVDKQHDLRSVTKSITSILMGIAIDKGFIDSIDDTYTRYIKDPAVRENRDERKKAITIRHLMTMSTGLDCNDWDRKSKGQEDRVYRKNDWLQYFLDLPMVNDPGTVSNYCTMGQVLATEAVSRASGMDIDTFAEEYLFKPLHITNVSWGHTSNKEVIPSAKRLYMTSRDLARIGQLMLNKGVWKGQRIVSEEWVEESTAPQTKITGIDYGLLWWTIPFRINGETVVSRSATGNGGQYLMIFPEEKLVAVFTGGAYNSQEDKLPFAIMNDVFLPTFRSRN